MHELSVMAYMLESVEAHAQRIGAKKVTAINLVIGERASIIDDSILFYFDALTPGTLAEGAQLNVRRTRMQFHCPTCDADYAPSGVDFRCPDCEAVGQVTDDGSEMLIESMEVET
ncbi:MAG: hydrogenase maturation nickel metallochaperone HypA [Thermomicrobiales bacterium]